MILNHSVQHLIHDIVKVLDIMPKLSVIILDLENSLSHR